jgi:RNA polymerase sigma-70 factor, ECF subfamily
MTSDSIAGRAAGPTAEAADLVLRAKSGDTRALDAIVRAEAPRVAGLLVRLLGPRQDLEDLIQTVFLEMCRALPRFRGESKLSTFIGGITVRVARRAMQPTPWWSRRAPMPAEPVADRPSPEQESFDREQLRRARAALDRLAPKKKIAFMLFEFEGMEVEEIAETVGASVDATRARIYHARKELRARAGKDPYLKELLQGEDDGA